MKPIPNYPGVFLLDGEIIYEVASFVRSSHRSRRRIISGRKFYCPATGGRNGKYSTVRLPCGVVCVHVLVCSAVHGPPVNGQEVRHLDGDHANNDPFNLEWGSRKENSLDTIRHGRGRAKLSPSDIVEIRERIAKGEPSTAIAPFYGVSHMAIHRIKHGLSWNHI